MCFILTLYILPLCYTYMFLMIYLVFDSFLYIYTCLLLLCCLGILCLHAFMHLHLLLHVLSIRSIFSYPFIHFFLCVLVCFTCNHCFILGSTCTLLTYIHYFCLHTYLSYLFYLPTHLLLPTYLPTYLPTHLPTYLPTTYLATYPPTYLPTYLLPTGYTGLFKQSFYIQV